MNRRNFFQGLLATTAIISTVSTKMIIDMAANMWRARGLSIVSTPQAGALFNFDGNGQRWILSYTRLSDLKRYFQGKRWTVRGV